MKLLIIALSLAFKIALVSLQQQELQLMHSYPENRKFDTVQLSCLLNETVPPEEPMFLLNDTEFSPTDTENLKIDVVNYDKTTASVTFTFTQDQEGWFSCSLGSAKSTNSIALAGILWQKIKDPYLYICYCKAYYVIKAGIMYVQITVSESGMHIIVT